MIKSGTQLKDENPMAPTECPSDFPEHFADIFINAQTQRRVSRARQAIKYTIESAQNSLPIVPLEKDEILKSINNVNQATCTTTPTIPYFYSNLRMQS